MQGFSCINKYADARQMIVGLFLAFYLSLC